MNKEGLIIGGGASGLMAAITAAENGSSVTILEHMPRVGKKILSTGNGKCNLTNLNMTDACFRCSEEGFPMQVIDRFSVDDTLRFFRRIGVLTTDRNGYVYPYSGQAQTVLDALRDRADSLGVRIVCECKILDIKKTKDERFLIKTDKGNQTGDFVVLAAGSMAAASTGSDGSGYELAKLLGHKVKKPLPALVQLKCRGDFFKAISGVRTEARVSLYMVGRHGDIGEFLAEDTGELQLTDYGISGIPVFQVSRYAADALNRNKQVVALIDYLPSYDARELFALLKEQRKNLSDRTAEMFLNGLFHKKLASLFLKAVSIRPETRAGKISDRSLEELCEVIKESVYEVTATNPYEKAQICMGGVDTREINPETMESKWISGLYFAGEILDVDGICGGYNLQWAWSSGYVAGISAAKRR